MLSTCSLRGIAHSLPREACCSGRAWQPHAALHLDPRPQVPGAMSLTSAGGRSKTLVIASSITASATTVQTHNVLCSQALSSGNDTTVDISIEELRRLAEDALATLGYSDAESWTIAEVLLYAELRDNSQSLVKVVSGGVERSAEWRPPSVQHLTPLSALLDGGGDLGILVMVQAVELAIGKAKAHGIGMVGTNHTSSGTGAIGFWARQLAEAGLIGIVLSQSPELVAPHGSSEAIFGTNPIGVGVPADGAPLVLDMGTSAFAYYALVEHSRAGLLVPDDVGYAADGTPTTDPGAILDGGAIRSFDRSYKGSHLALVVELLAGPLVGAAFADKLQARNWGNLLLAIDPGLLGDAAAFKEQAAALLRQVQEAKPLPGTSGPTLPGRRGDALAEERVAAGHMPMSALLLRDLRHMVASARARSGASHLEPHSGSTAQLQPLTHGSASRMMQVPDQAVVQVRVAEGEEVVAGLPDVLGSAGLAISTRILHPPQSLRDPYASSNLPLYQTATFAQPSATEGGMYDYTRSGNPTRTALEEQLAALDGAERSFVFTSGMSALVAVVRLVKSGQHILAGDDIYGGTSRLLSSVVPYQGVDVSNVDMTDIRAVEAGLIPGKTAMVMLESPTNPRMQVCDIAAICAAAHAVGALVCVDNSIMASVFQQPLALGADICMTSATKFVGGHSDLMAGIISVRSADLAKRVAFHVNAEGSGLAPFDCWLLLRGIKTMALRMERQAFNAARLADFLVGHPLVRKVNYPGLPQHTGSELHAAQATSGGSVLSFETGSLEASRVIVDDTKFFKITVSFGNVVSLISLPCFMSHASIPAEVRAARGLPDDLVRISAGIEDIDDLLADLEQAFGKAMQAIGMVGSHVQRRRIVGTPAAREQRLLARIAELEQQLSN